MFVLGLWGLMLTHWWASKPLVLMVLAGIIVTEWAPQNDCYHFLCLQGSFQWPLGGSPRWAVDSDPDFFQIDFFSVLTQSVRFLHAIINSRVSFLYPSHCPVHMFPVLQIEVFWGPVFQHKTQAVESFVAPGTLTPWGKNLRNCDYALICGSPIQRCGFSLYHISAPHTPHTPHTHLVMVSITLVA